MKAKNRVLFDIAFWIGIKSYEVLSYSTAKGGFTYAWQNAISRFPAELILYYAVTIYFIPGYFTRERRARNFIAFGFLLLLSIIVYRIGRGYYFPVKDMSYWESVFNIPSLFYSVFYFLSIPALKFIIDIVRKLNKTEIARKETEKLKVLAEMKFLKSQVNPHFLFNTLNNLYSLSIKQSPHTPAYILKLSAIMEYIIYESYKNTVSIETELTHIMNYVDLERLRYGSRLEVSWDIDMSVQHIEIPALLFFPFVENAFKHGASMDDESTWISISLKKEDDQLTYVVVNSTPKTEPVQTNRASGKGLENLRRRLDLAYGGNYKLSETKNEGSFMSNLCIQV